MKSIFAILMTAVMLLSVLTGCGNKKTNGTTGTTTAPTSTAAPATETDNGVNATSGAQETEGPLESAFPEMSQDVEDAKDDVVNDLEGNGEQPNGNVSTDDNGVIKE